MEKYEIGLPEIGEKVTTETGEYEILRRIGNGNYGVVFEVKDSSGVRYAMKTSLNDDEAIAALKKELKVLQKCSKVNSTHILELVDHGTIADRYSFLVMPLAGFDFNQLQNIHGLFRKQNFGIGIILAIKTFEAVRDLHSVGFIHGDIHSTNFAVVEKEDGEELSVFILDFGLSQQIRDDDDETESEASKFETDDIKQWFMMVSQWIPKVAPKMYGNNDCLILQRKPDLDDAETFCPNMPSVFNEIHNYIFSLEDGEKPSYNYIQSCLNVAYNKLRYAKDDKKISAVEKDSKKVVFSNETKPYYKHSSLKIHFHIHFDGYVYKFIIHGKSKNFLCRTPGCNVGFFVADYDESKIVDYQEAIVSKLPCRSDHTCASSSAPTKMERKVIDDFVPMEIGATIEGDSKEIYEVVSIIKQNRFGAVYQVKDQSGNLYAMKFSSNNTESDVYNTFMKETSFHFCRFFEKFFGGQFTYIFLTLTGQNLAELRTIESAFTLKVALLLAKETLKAIQDLHSVGFIHGDINERHFAIGRNGTKESNCLYLLDFSKSFKLNKQTTKFIKEDLLQWFFMICKWISFPPWKNEEEESKVLEMKRVVQNKFSEIHEKFFKMLPRNFAGIFDYILSLQNGEEVEYGFLFDSLNLSCERMKDALVSCIYLNGEELEFDKMKFNISKPFYFISNQKKQFKVIHNFEVYTFKEYNVKGAIFRCIFQSKGCKRYLIVSGYDCKITRNGFEAVILEEVNLHTCKLSEEERTRNRKEFTDMVASHSYPTML